MANFIENPFAYFNYLKICKSKGDGFECLSDVNFELIHNLKIKKYYDIISFKTYICELIYNAINLFPEIDSYTITCKSEDIISVLTFGFFDEIAEDGHKCMLKFKNNEASHDYLFNLKEIQQLYCNNRYNDDNNPDSIVNTLLAFLLMTGSVPTVTTEYTISKKELNKKLKIKN